MNSAITCWAYLIVTETANLFAMVSQEGESSVMTSWPSQTVHQYKEHWPQTTLCLLAPFEKTKYQLFLARQYFYAINTVPNLSALIYATRQWKSENKHSLRILYHEQQNLSTHSKFTLCMKTCIRLCVCLCEWGFPHGESPYIRKDKIVANASELWYAYIY
jgi:hypothetical protein